MPDHIVFCREEACLGTGAIGALGHGVNHGIFVGPHAYICAEFGLG
jgi:hypothetical protein